MDAFLYDHYNRSGTPFGLSSELGPFIAAASHRDLIDGIVNDVLGGQTITAVVRHHDTGKINLLPALGWALRQQGFLVVEVPREVQTPPKVQRLVAQAIGVSAAGTPGPDKVLQTLQIASGANDIVLLFDNAQDLSAAMFRYLWLMVKLLHLGKTKLHLVLLGDSDGWRGWDHPDLDPLREAAGLRVFTPAGLNEPSTIAPGLPKRFLLKPAVTALLAAALPVLVTATILMNPRHAAPNFTAAKPPEAITTVPPDPATTRADPADQAALVPKPPATLPSAPTLTMAPTSTPAPLPTPKAPSPQQATVQPPAPAELASSPPVRRGAAGLVLEAQAGDTISTLYGKLYQGLTPPPYDAVVALNQAPIKPGALVVFPEPPHGWAQH